MSDSSLHAALKEAERVCKKQRLCSSRTIDGVGALLASAQTARQALLQEQQPQRGVGGGTAASSSSSAQGPSPGGLPLRGQQHQGQGQQQGAQGQGGGAAALTALHQRLESLGVASSAAGDTKELHSAVSKLGKALDKAFEGDVCKASRDIAFDKATLDKVVAGHLYQEGSFEVGDTLVKEAGIAGGAQLKAPFVEMHLVLQEIRKRNLAPAQQWIESHREELAESGVEDGFEFRLHRLQYLHILSMEGQSAALAYARAHFSPFCNSQLRDIQRLMGLLAFSRRPSGGGASGSGGGSRGGGSPTPRPSPYADLLDPERWAEFAREFGRNCCALTGRPPCSPLLVATSAGAAALPTLLKLATVMSGQIHNIKTCEQLPVELELGSEFVFSSIFACPVSREQSTADNPPMLLPCGHVLCRQSVIKIAKSSSRAFKCPYCPVEATLAACKQLHFPHVD